MCLAVAFELSYFLANWNTLLAGNLSKLTLPSLMVLDTKSSSFRKNQKMSLWSILAVSRGIWLSLLVSAQHCTTHPCCSFLVLKLVSKSNLAQTLLDCGLQYSSYFPHIVSRVSSFEDRFQDTHWSIVQSPLHAITFCTAHILGELQVCIPKYFLHLRHHLKNL